MPRTSGVLALLLTLALGGGCTTDPGGPADAGTDLGADRGSDAGTDGIVDGISEASTDADAGPVETLGLVRHVDPFIGTDDSNSPHPVPGGAGGSTYPGAVVPFGMVQFSPDTPTASPSGYRYRDTLIEQFSLTHFDGAGCPNNEDLPILPFVGEVSASVATRWSAYRSAYAKASEVASPGYYRVDLDRYRVRAELTATTRTGLARFTYPPSDVARVLVHSGRSATGTRDGSFEIVAPDRIRGTVTAGGFCGSMTSFEIHYVIVFDRPFTGHGTWLGGTVTPGSSRVTGSPSGGYVTFDTTSAPTVLIKVGISYVSVANAEANLAAENPGWDFDAVRNRAAGAWNRVLDRVQVTGASEDDLRRFYTALYHVFQSPSVASDVNGEYMGFDGSAHTSERVIYQNYSGWDIIRSWMHLVAALAPEAPDIVHSMVQDGVEGGLLPFWSHQNVETNVMVGDPGTVNVANAYAMGVRGFDTAAALELMVRSADDVRHTHRWGLDSWINRHYAGNAAISLEYAMADFALAQYARALGDTAAHGRYMARSGYWAESWNEADGYIEARVTGAAPGANAARIYEFEVFGPDAPATNLALTGVATASASCSASEGPERANNGTWTGGPSDKWCDSTSRNKWWQVDLGAARRIDRVVVHHAGAGGESEAWNTRDFAITVSEDGMRWTPVATVTGNTASTSVHAVAATSARYVRLEITAAIQAGTVGAWDCQPFDRAAECGFIEGNAAQYVWLVPHDMAGLFTRMGGVSRAVTRLDDLFTELNAGTRRPYFYIGNEPEHGTPWTYNFARAPWRTQEVVRRIVSEEFNTGAGGLPGNDDLGATSAWLVWAYLGMYPVIPGSDVLAVHGPRFPSATVHLASGHTLAIRATGSGAGSPYVHGLRVDGAQTTRNWLRFGDIVGGAELVYAMGSTPNRDWGSGEGDVPPSYPP